MHYTESVGRLAPETLRTSIAIAVTALALVACSNGMTVRAEVVQPARVPVRAFPRILVTSDSTAEADEIADQLARHLAIGRSNVRRLDPRAVTLLREAREMPRATVVVDVRVGLSRRDRPEWNRPSSMICGPIGCVDDRRPTIQDVPVLVGELALTVIDGGSGRVLQREQLSEEDSGMDLLGMRLRVLERLSQRALELVDQRAAQVPVVLHPIEDPRVRAALDEVRGGSWTRGRELLEAFRASDDFEALPPEQRALVLYDIGQMLRFDRSMPADRRFDEAARMLNAAIRLVPAPRFAAALGELEEQRHSRAMVLEQEDATAHNFALSDAPPGSPSSERSAEGAPPTVPQPPDAYRD